MAISKRIFGSDIPLKVKQKLALRQELNKTFDFGEAIGSALSIYPPGENEETIQESDYGTNFGGIADLSSRTPFARLWTSIKLYDAYPQEGGKINYSEKPDSNRTYVIGNHVYNNSKNANPTDTIGPPTAEEAQYDLLPLSELHENTFMMPPAGITSITSTTEGTLGVIKKTTINFTVNNFTDYDKIYSRFFLKPGAQLIVDFGWDTSDLYDPETLINYESKAEDLGFGEYTPTSFNDALYGDNGFVTRAAGDMETLVGFVTNYDAKIKDNGTVECSVEITSKNAALLNNDLNSNGNILTRIAEELDNAILDYALKRSKKRGQHIMNSWKKSPADLEAFEKDVDDYGSRQLYNIILLPPAIAVEHGVFWVGDVSTSTPVRKNIFISYGLFEDFVLNPEFAHGKVDMDTINEDDDAIKFDSRNSFVSFNKEIIKYQKTIKDSLKIDMLYPFNWDNSYNVGLGRIPIAHQELLEKNPDVSITNFDKSVGRIPLRELFISVETIKTIFTNLESEGSMLDVLKELFKKIKADSFNMIDLKLSNNGNSSIVSPVDINTLDIETNNKDEDNNFKKLFTFKPNSPNSIVKTFDVSFSMPSGNYSNMIAIQSIGTGGSQTIFPITEFLDEALALESFNIVNKITVEEGEVQVTERISVGYLPDIGSYRSDEMGKDIERDNYIGFNFGDTFDNLFNVAEMDNKINMQMRADSQIADKSTTIGDSDSTNLTNSVDLQREASDGSIEEFYAKAETDDGYILTNTYQEYQAAIVKQSKSIQTNKKNSSILPLTLNLGIYGISSITPGDVFKVDYLPQRYINTVYFQIMKVSHNLDSSGWTTNFETQFRIRKFTKIEGGLYKKYAGVTLNRKILKNLKLLNLDLIIERINHLKLDDAQTGDEKKLDGIFSFDSTKGLDYIAGGGVSDFELPYYIGGDVPQSDVIMVNGAQIYNLWELSNEDYFEFKNLFFKYGDVPTNAPLWGDYINWEELDATWMNQESQFRVGSTGKTKLLKIRIQPVFEKSTAEKKITYKLIYKDNIWFTIPSDLQKEYDFLVKLLSGTALKISKAFSPRLDDPLAEPEEDTFLQYDTGCDACAQCGVGPGGCDAGTGVGQCPPTYCDWDWNPVWNDCTPKACCNAHWDDASGQIIEAGCPPPPL